MGDLSDKTKKLTSDQKRMFIRVLNRTSFFVDKNHIYVNGKGGNLQNHHYGPEDEIAVIEGNFKEGFWVQFNDTNKFPGRLYRSIKEKYKISGAY